MPEFGWDRVTEDEKEKILKGMEEGKPYQFPKSIEIDWTDRCNLECIFCYQKPLELEERFVFGKKVKILNLDFCLIL